MREILFRGKKRNGEWVEGDLLHTTVDREPRIRSFGLNCAGVYDVIPETVGQYTGLTDKNGKKIFEGDIVILQLVDLKETGCIKWSYIDCSLKFASPDGMAYGIDCTDVFVVIGNIHDNPELL